MLMFIPTYGMLLLIRFFAVITKYTVLDEQRREAKEGKSQRQNPRSITRGARCGRTKVVVTYSVTHDKRSALCFYTVM